MIGILRFIAAHPLTRERQAAALGRLLRYQIATRTRKRTVMPWIDGAKLVVSKNMAGASGNIYCGLHEFAEMGFFLHFLQPDDLFLDIGANVGSFTVLASKVCGARTIAFEPDPSTAEDLRRNLVANDIDDRVTIAQLALADRSGTVSFTVGQDSMNKIVAGGAGQTVRCERLDDYLQGAVPVALKMDVEGGEAGVIAGAGRTLSSPDLMAIETEAMTDDVVAPLLAHGFKRAYYDPTTRNLTETPNRLMVSNALFVRDFSACMERIRSAPARAVLPGVRL